MGLHTIEIICLVLIPIIEGSVNENTLDRSKGTAEEDRKFILQAENEKNNTLEYQENDEVEDKGQLLFKNKIKEFVNEKKYIHPRGNRKYLSDYYGEEHSDISDDNIDGEEAHVYGKVDESSNEDLDSSFLANITSDEDNEYDAKVPEKSIINEEESMNTRNNANNARFENIISANTENVLPDTSYPENDEDDEDESYLSPDVESFWDAVDTFISMNPYSDNLENDDSGEPEDLYDYLYTPSGNSPGIDHFLDLLHFIKDVGDTVERIEKGSGSELNNIHDDAPRRKRCATSENPEPRSNNLAHKKFSAGLGVGFRILRFDIPFSNVQFLPFQDPLPLG